VLAKARCERRRRDRRRHGCFVHFHVLVPDDVFIRVEDDGAVVFREGSAPQVAPGHTSVCRACAAMDPSTLFPSRVTS
jgi:hypothetical protein